MAKKGFNCFKSGCFDGSNCINLKEDGTPINWLRDFEGDYELERLMDYAFVKERTGVDKSYLTTECDISKLLASLFMTQNYTGYGIKNWKKGHKLCCSFRTVGKKFYRSEDIEFYSTKYLTPEYKDDTIVNLIWLSARNIVDVEFYDSNNRKVKIPKEYFSWVNVQCESARERVNSCSWLKYHEKYKIESVRYSMEQSIYLLTEKISYFVVDTNTKGFYSYMAKAYDEYAFSNDTEVKKLLKIAG